MIIGNGLIASAFKRAENIFGDFNICIYAAGVSNSLATESQAFEREKTLLLESMKANARKKIIYFSTCSIYDSQKSKSDYVLHKINMETIVTSHKNSIIFRLPQIAGFSSNNATLLNYLYNKILKNESFNTQINAKRNIVDVDDVVRIVKYFLEFDSSSNIVNIANPINSTIFELIEIFETLLKKTANFKIVEGGSGYSIDIAQQQYLLNLRNHKIFSERYLINVIRKYYVPL